MSSGPLSEAIVFSRPGRLERRALRLDTPAEGELLVEVDASGISTGTEKLLWRGTMPSFPGLGYPLVPGYEAVGTVRGSGPGCALALGTRVFVPGTSRWTDEVRGLFGASASHLLVAESRVTPIGDLASERGVLLALAATAMHTLTARLRHARPGVPVALADLAAVAPELIVGHGVLGRLLARIVLAVGAPAPLVWDNRAARREGGRGYEVVDPADDAAAPRDRITDVSGAGQLLDTLIGKLARGGHLVLGGFYDAPLSFAFPPAFLREASLSVAAEWAPEDLALTLALVEAGALDLDGLVSHERPADEADAAYVQAFDDPDCLKMILHWSHA